MKKERTTNVDRLMKTMSIEILPIEELKKPVMHPENFDLFMKKAVKIEDKTRKKRIKK